MVAQRMYLTQTATVNNLGMVFFNFPQVPQGLAWTGSVSMTIAPQVSPGLNPELVHGIIQGATWWLFRNQSPILQMAGSGTAADVQCVGQETLSITGAGLVEGDQVTAVWSGTSEDIGTAGIVQPHPYGVTPAAVQVYNGDGTTGPLEVTQVPDPSRALRVATGFASTGNAVVTMFTPGVAASGVEILELMLQVTTAQSSTTAQAVPFLATLRLNDGAGQTNILASETIIVQADQQCATTVLPMHQYPIAQNQTLELVTGALSGTNVARVNATAVLSVVPLAP